MHEDYLMISGIQHFAFCPRQWALIHIEQQWNENVRTVDGNIFHQRAHHGEAHEHRGDLMIVRGLHICSEKLKVTGICDVVEFRASPDGVPIFGYEGKWTPYPVEYKKGEPKDHDADRLQLCVQAMCLEEMLSCSILEGALFYGEPRRREKVLLSESLRKESESVIQMMHQYYERGYTPRAKRTKACNACSLKDICIPQMDKTMTVNNYIEQRIRDAQ